MQNFSIELIQSRETDYNLQFVFTGNMFRWQTNSSFANGVTNFQIKTSTGKLVHLVNREIQTASTGLTLTFNEKGVKADGIQTISGLSNENQSSTKMPSAKLYTTPTTSTGGVTAPIQLFTSKLIPNTANTQLAREVILKSNTNYLITVSNSGAATKMNLNFVWYESNN